MSLGLETSRDLFFTSLFSVLVLNLGVLVLVLVWDKKVLVSVLVLEKQVLNASLVSGIGHLHGIGLTLTLISVRDQRSSGGLCMQDDKSRHVTVMIYDSLVNTGHQQLLTGSFS